MKLEENCLNNILAESRKSSASILKSNTENQMQKSVVNMFLRNAICEHGIHFELKLEATNETTTDVIEEGRKLMAWNFRESYFTICQ